MIYFVQGCLSKKIKIGKTEQCPAAYVKATIQSRCGETVRLLGVISDGVEKEIQNVFRASWSHGEWFNPTEDLTQYISQNAQAHSCSKCPTTLTTASPWTRSKPHKKKKRGPRRVPRDFSWPKRSDNASYNRSG
jgi:hypothetical protein